MSDEPTVKKAKTQDGAAKNHFDIDCVISFDVEVTGMNLVKHWMPELGASFWRIGDKQPTKTFYRAIEQPPLTSWCPKTLSQFWNNPEKGEGKVVAPIVAYNKRRAAATIHSPAAAMSDFVDWVREIARDCEKNGLKVLLISDTDLFDKSWVNYYLSMYCEDKCEYLGDIFGKYTPTRDISAFYFGIGRRLQKHGSVETALSAFGETETPEWVKAYAHNHDPLSDANSIGAAASYILSKCA